MFDCIGVRVTRAQNEALTQEFTECEVKDDLFAMHPDKSPGSDGMNPSFYQKFWDIVGTWQRCF